jgi:hypothetical protein
MMTAYFDESYSHPPRVYTVAGYISSDAKWSEFEKDWQRTLDREYLPPFSMKEFDNPHSKVYGQWESEKKVSFLKELHGHIQKYYQRSFSTGIVITDYEELSNKEKFAFGSPHLCAAINCAKHIGEWADSINLNEPIRYVFEQGTVNDKQLSRLFNDLLSEEQKLQYRIKNCEFGTKILQPLQAADILAVETRKEMSRRLETNKPRGTRKSILNLHVPTLDNWCYMDKAEFNKITGMQIWKEAINDI